MSDKDWFKEYQKNVDSNAKWRSRKEQKALNDKWDKSDMTHTKECTYRNNHDFRHDNCFCTCHSKNEKKKGNLKPELRKNMEKTLPKVMML
jgi:hypothetical protein